MAIAKVCGITKIIIGLVLCTVAYVPVSAQNAALSTGLQTGAGVGQLIIMNNMDHDVVLTIDNLSIATKAGVAYTYYFTSTIVGIPYADDFVKGLQHYEHGVWASWDSVLDKSITLRVGYSYQLYFMQGMGKKIILSKGVRYQAGVDGDNIFHSPFNDEVSNDSNN